MSAAFHNLRVEDVRKEISGAISVRFAVPEELRETFAFSSGQHLTLRAMIEGEDTRRNYSICSSPLEGEMRVAIKRLAGGLFSNWANDTLAVGQTLEVMPPHGSFTWEFDATRKAAYAGFAAGSGITPILSLLKTALLAEPKSTFTLFYANRSAASVMFLEELAAIKNRFMDRLIVHHFLKDEEGDFEIFNGRLDGPKVEEVLARLIDPASIDATFVCGPEGMMEAVETSLQACGVPSDRILVERFTAGEMSAAQRSVAQELERKAEGRTLRMKISGRRRTIAYHAQHGSILENARAEGLPAPFACKAGVCATCRAKVISGEVKMIQNFGLSGREVEQGYVLTCQAVPLTDEVELDFDA